MQLEPRILILEDNPADAELSERALRKAGLTFTAKRVETRDAYLQALTDFAPNMILSDYGLPQFNGVEALRLLRDRELETPFILVTGSLTEEVAVECMKEGASDYILKTSLTRLPSAVLNALEKSEARRAKEAAIEGLRRSEEKYRNVVENVKEVIFQTDASGKWTFLNPAWTEITGFTIEESLGQPFLNFVHPDDRQTNLKRFQPLIEGRHDDCRYEVRFLTGDGGFRWIEGYARATPGARGEVVGTAGSLHDITERKEAEELLRRREAILEAVSMAAEHFLRTRDWEQNIEEVLAHLGKAAGASRTHIFEKHSGPDRTLLSSHRYEWSAPEDISGQGKCSEQRKCSYCAGGLARWEATLSRGEIIQGLTREFPPCEQEFLAAEGVLSVIIVPVFINEDWWGNIGFDDCRHERTWSATEVDALKAAASTLGAAIQRQQSEKALLEREEQLRQSQRLEAVGQLAGGIAHDFNNLLTAITGYSDLTLRHLETESPLRRNVEEIKKAGGRASSLTRQLLAFSRKQVLQPRVLALNDIVADMDKMFRRLIGEDIEVQMVLDPELGHVKADAGQIEQVIMNLVINARDAMPQGGNLTIETANVELSEDYARRRISVQGGRYIMLAVSDTGHGMDAATQSRIFEPFFTTKEIGKGTGLGLSTVYGIVRQSGGNIWVYSELSHGTTFKIYLPRVDEAPQPAQPVVRDLSQPATETILLVEDEEVVRRLLCEVLKAEGYHVLETASGSEALKVCRSHEGEIDLMLTDVVMPEMSGRETAERVTALRPEMKVVFMSGYTDDSIVHHGILNPGVELLEKPFTPSAVARKVRDVLDGTLHATAQRD